MHPSDVGPTAMTNGDLARALRTIVQAHGIDAIATNGLWLRDTLDRLSPETGPLNQLAFVAARRGVPKSLKSAATGGWLPDAKARRIDELDADLCFDRQAAITVVDAWAEALELSDASDKPATESAGTGAPFGGGEDERDALEGELARLEGERAVLAAENERLRAEMTALNGVMMAHAEAVVGLLSAELTQETRLYRERSQRIQAAIDVVQEVSTRTLLRSETDTAYRSGDVDSEAMPSVIAMPPQPPVRAGSTPDGPLDSAPDTTRYLDPLAPTMQIGAPKPSATTHEIRQPSGGPYAHEEGVLADSISESADAVTLVEIRGIAGISAALTIQRTIAKVSGVLDVEVIRFERAILYLSVRHDTNLDLRESFLDIHDINVAPISEANGILALRYLGAGRRYQKPEPPPLRIPGDGELLPGADLRRCNLSGRKLIAIDLRMANLSGTNFYKADLTDSKLSGACLQDANLSGASLRAADLSKTDLQRADLSGAVMWRANLSDAIVSDANLRGADLSWARLVGADLTNADITGTNLTRANLSGARVAGTLLEQSDTATQR